jgi:small subunit ribosomal protein S6
MQTQVRRFEAVIRDNGGTLDATHDWGSRRLAYTIRKKADGHYFLFEYTAEAPVVSELERTLRITESVLRYMTVQQEHTGLPPARVRDTGTRADVPLSELRSLGSDLEEVEAGVERDTAEKRPPEDLPDE